MKMFETEKTEEWTVIQQGTLFQPREKVGSPSLIYCIIDTGFDPDSKKPTLATLQLHSDGFSTALTTSDWASNIGKVVGQIDSQEVKEKFVQAFKSTHEGIEPTEKIMHDIDVASKKAPFVVFVGK